MSLTWIPNSITMANLLFGFLAIIFSSKGHFPQASFCILFAVLLDGCDGQVARMLKVSSRIGAELDSLADCVTFGVAPGFLFFSAYLSNLSLSIGLKPIPIGMFIAALYPLCAAYRLARFNVVHEDNSFVGLPSPVAGTVVALLPITTLKTGIIENNFILLPIFILVSILMISTVKFSKPQVVIQNRIYGIRLILFLSFLIIISIIFRKWVIFMMIGLLLLYIISAMITFFIQFVQEHKY